MIVYSKLFLSISYLDLILFVKTFRVFIDTKFLLFLRPYNTSTYLTSINYIYNVYIVSIVNHL